MLFIDALDAWLTGEGLGFLITIIDILLVVGVTWLLITLANRLIRYTLDRQTRDKPPALRKRLETAGGVARGTVKAVCLFIAGAVILGELGLEKAMTSMLAAAGVGSVVLGVGAQSLIGDVAQGLFMLMENVMDVGDYVKLNDISGTVESIGLRTTVLKGLRGQIETVNNGQIKCVTNYTRSGFMALVDVQIAYEADVQKARALMRAAAEGYVAPADAENVTDFGVVNLGESGVTLRVGVMVEDHMDHWRVQRELSERIKADFAAAGIEIPYNKLVVIEHDRQ